MKKTWKIFKICFIVCTIFIIGLYCGIILNDNTKNLYPRTMKVLDVDKTENTVVLIDAVGYMWKIEEAEDWEINDLCSCIMNDNGTTSIVDDVIVSIRYNSSFKKDL